MWIWPGRSRDVEVQSIESVRRSLDRYGRITLEGSRGRPTPAGRAYARAVTRRGAAAGSFVFVVAQPGLMGGLVPYWLTDGWEGADSPLVLRLAGAALLAAGLGFLAHTVIRFAVEGLGT